MKKKKYIKCVRCHAVATMLVDFGLLGKLWLCPVCWIGLAGAMYRDFKVYLDDNLDYMQEMQKASQREQWFKENNLTSKEVK